MAEIIYGPFDTDNTRWKFYYGIDVVSYTISSYDVKVNLYMGCGYNSPSDRYWTNAKWNFPIMFANKLLGSGGEYHSDIQ